LRYVGGKSKIAGRIRDAILANSTDRRAYLEPFVGGGSTFERNALAFSFAVAGDLSEDLVMMWNALLFSDWEPPPVVSESEYSSLRSAEPSALRGFVGLGGSFGGKWFAGYARGGTNSDGTPRNHQAESARSLIKTRNILQSMGGLGRFRHTSYDNWGLDGGVVYCDPPYASTQGYSTGSFDSIAFWEKMEEWAGRGAQVFVSEYTAPDNWVDILSIDHRQSLTLAHQRNTRTEKLFTLLA